MISNYTEKQSKISHVHLNGNYIYPYIYSILNHVVISILSVQFGLGAINIIKILQSEQECCDHLQQCNFRAITGSEASHLNRLERTMTSPCICDIGWAREI